MDILKHPRNLRLREFHGLYTQAPEMEQLLRRVERVARIDCTVLVRGESGSGKELVARALHVLSPRRRGPFRAVNCATLSPTLLESELFGHKRGAFTGAVRDHHGLFEQADQGTLFLDEVAEMPLDIQARLLRVLEERTFVPVGGTKAISVNVRLVSASNQALRRAVARSDSATTCATIRSCRSSCHRCAGAPATSKRSSGTSSTASPNAASGAWTLSRGAPWTVCRVIPGPVTCASCAT
jgi:transcriptional regulator with PAS, ATPase and Fis domain